MAGVSRDEAEIAFECCGRDQQIREVQGLTRQFKFRLKFQPGVQSSE